MDWIKFKNYFVYNRNSSDKSHKHHKLCNYQGVKSIYKKKIA